MEAAWVRHVRLPSPISGVRIVSPEDQAGAGVTLPSQTQPQEPQLAPPSAGEISIVELFEELSRGLDDLNRRRRQTLQEMQQVAVELSLLVASHILRERLDKDAFPVEQLLSEAIERLAPHQPIEIRLHPQDLQMMEQKLGDQLPSWDLEHVRFVPDSSLSRGSCFADAAECGLLSSLEQRLTDVRHRLLEGLDDAEVERRQTGSGADSLRRFPDRREIA